MKIEHYKDYEHINLVLNKLNIAEWPSEKKHVNFECSNNTNNNRVKQQILIKLLFAEKPKIMHVHYNKLAFTYALTTSHYVTTAPRPNNSLLYNGEPMGMDRFRFNRFKVRRDFYKQ